MSPKTPLKPSPNSTKLESKDDQKTIFICEGTGCVSGKAVEIRKALERAVAEAGLENVTVDFTGCHGFCEQGPIAVVEPEGIFYTHVSVEDAPEIVQSHLRDGQPVERLFYKDPVSGQVVPRHKDIDFYAKQQRVVLRNCGRINPERIEDYLAQGGYQSLRKILSEMTPEQVIDEVKRSGLRGRGGGGFPTGIKWESCRNAQGDIKYAIVNADEGDPGAYADRSLLEGNPHSVLEGLIIGAYAIGAHDGYIYVRAEYPLAVENIDMAIKQAEEYGLLGQNILGSGFNFKIDVHRGAGAFVCGEETALIASLEGRIGEPRQRPPFPATSGLWGKPTNINNVETWATVPLIINRGSKWFERLGTEGSKGTKIFSLVGKVNNTGLVEVPMGITLREIVYDIGAGIPGDKKFKAVQTGGPSGGCIPESLLDLPVDFDRLTEVGSMMGSGGMIVMDESTCMVDVAKYFINFLRDESCGKCTSCREGTQRMYEVLNDITEGRGKKGDVELLEELGWVVAEASLCALGGTAPNPVLSTIQYFRDEYEAHIAEKRCPAGVCKALIQYTIEPELCTACGLCRKACPSDAISGAKKVPHKIDQEKCIKCGMCVESCKFDAVNVQ